MKTSEKIAALMCVGATSVMAQPHHHGDDGVVGVSGAGMLAIEIDLDEVFEFEELFSNGSLNGWISDAPGFTALDEDEPDEDFFMLGAGADIHFQLVGTNVDAMQVYNPFFDVPAMVPGETFAFGTGDFDTHPFWFLNTDAASFDPNDSEWSVDFRVVDQGTTGYADSEVYTIRFAIPSPAGASVLAMAGLVATRRRR
ncbi:MAG: hypothetical protein Phyf2KO_09550 [Phycisphaerales bacterium]